MREIPTFLKTKIGTSIRVGNFFILANSLAEYVKIYSAPALFHTEEARPYHLSKSGSISLIKHRERNIALAAYHQFSKHKYDFNQLCISNPQRGTLLGPQFVTFPKGQTEQQEDYDCVLLEYTEPVQNGLLSRDIWFDLAHSDKEESKVDPIALLCIGYPGHRNSIDYDAGTYAVAPNAVWGLPARGGISGRRSFAPINDLDFDPEGMSGAPVFRIDNLGATLVLNFAGILTEATSQMFNYFSIDRIFPNYLRQID